VFARASVVVVCALTATACDRCGSRPESTEDSGATALAAEPDDAGSNEERGEAGAVRPARSAEPKAEGAFLDGGVDPACTGMAIDLAAVIADARCAIDSTTAKALRAAVEAEDAGVASFKQEAKRTGDGKDAKIELRVVNHGAKGIVLPLSWHPKVAAFMVLADSPTEKAVYELETPRLEVAEGVGAKGGRFARVLVPPNGAMVARIAVSPRITRRVDKKDAGAVPAAISPGKWTLHVAQFVCDVEVGEPAIVGWDIEAPH